MFDWWTTLDLARQLFLFLAIIATMVLCGQLVLQMLGMGNADLELGDLGSANAGDHGSGLGFISVRTITAFFAGFGWTGYAALSSGLPLWLAMTLAIIVGISLMVALVYLMRGMLKLNSSGTLDYKNAKGITGKVYTTIPANRAGFGQVEIQLQGRLTMVQALSTSPIPLAPGTPITVVDQHDQSTVLVAPLA